MLSLHDRITSGGGSSTPLVPVANTDSCSAALPEIGGVLGGGVSRDVLVEAAGGTVTVRFGAEAVVHGKTLAAVAIPAAKIAQSATTMAAVLTVR
jgi:hypothetical protein